LGTGKWGSRVPYSKRRFGLMRQKSALPWGGSGAARPAAVRRTLLYTGSSVENLISSIDKSAVTLKIFTSEISAW